MRSGKRVTWRDPISSQIPRDTTVTFPLHVDTAVLFLHCFLAVLLWICVLFLFTCWEDVACAFVLSIDFVLDSIVLMLFLLSYVVLSVVAQLVHFYNIVSYGLLQLLRLM